MQVKRVSAQVTDLTSEPFVKRELALIKVRCEAGQRREVSDLAAIFHGTICDVSLGTVTLEMQGKETKIGALQGLLAPYGAHTKRTARSRQHKSEAAGKQISFPYSCMELACMRSLWLITKITCTRRPGDARTTTCEHARIRAGLEDPAEAHITRLHGNVNASSSLQAVCCARRHPGGGAHGPRGAGA